MGEINLIYILIILVMRVVQAVENKRASQLLPEALTGRVKYITCYCAIAAAFAFVTLVFSGEIKNIDLPTVVIAGLSGLSLAGGSVCGLIAMQSGTMTLSSMFSSAGLLVPCFAGIFLFGEHIGIFQWAAMALLMVSAYLLIKSSKDIYPQFSLKTFILLILSMLTNGLTMLFQKLFSYYVTDGSVSMFSFLTFAIPAVLLAVFGKCICGADKEEKSFRMPKKLVLAAVLLAAAVFVINQLATLAASSISSIVLFASINGGATIITALVGAIMYKEKLNARSTVGVILGIAALILIKAFE